VKARPSLNSKGIPAAATTPSVTPEREPNAGHGSLKEQRGITAGLCLQDNTFDQEAQLLQTDTSIKQWQR